LRCKKEVFEGKMIKFEGAKHFLSVEDVRIRMKPG
jgi:hypothetical protein